MSGEKDIKQEAIEHYNRMIAFAAECKENNIEFHRIPLVFFQTNFGEDWQGYNCSYCGEYCYKKTNWYNLSCGECPLNPLESKDPAFCCGGLWNRISITRTWDTLIKALTDVKKYIEIWG